MTNEEARWILKFHRPDRPRSADRRQLQKAIDVFLEEGEWIPCTDYDGFTYWRCPSCGMFNDFERFKYCPDCGKKMKH